MHEPSAVYKQSFNAERQLRENFATEIAKKKYSVLTIPKTQEHVEHKSSIEHRNKMDSQKTKVDKNR